MGNVTGKSRPNDRVVDVRRVRVGCEFVHVAAIDTPAVIARTNDPRVASLLEPLLEAATALRDGDAAQPRRDPS